MNQRIFALLFCLIAGTVNLFGQSPITEAADRVRQEPGNLEARRRYEIEQRRERQTLESGRDGNGMMINPVNRAPVKKIKKTEEEERAKSIKEAMKMLEPSTAYYEKYKGFLSAKNTGIARIFPDKGCVMDKVISVTDAERCVDVPKEITKNGSLYSFSLAKNFLDLNDKRSRKLNRQGWWDIHFVDQNFVAGNCCTQGMVVNLGDVAVDGLHLKSEGVDYLIAFKAKETVDEIQQQNKLLDQGIKANGYIYQKRSAVKSDNSYAVRSIAYGTEKSKELVQVQHLKILSDTVTVFRIVGVEPDKSLIIIWKNLESMN